MGRIPYVNFAKPDEFRTALKDPCLKWKRRTHNIVQEVILHMNRNNLIICTYYLSLDIPEKKNVITKSN